MGWLHACREWEECMEMRAMLTVDEVMCDVHLAGVLQVVECNVAESG